MDFSKDHYYEFNIRMCNETLNNRSYIEMRGFFFYHEESKALAQINLQLAIIAPFKTAIQAY